MKEGEYEVSLPWKDDISKSLPTYIQVCKRRLKSLYLNLKEKHDLLRQYNDILEEQLASGIIERVPKELKYKDDAHSPVILE